MSMQSKLAFFVGGAVFGSVGLKILAGSDAKKVYVKTAAAGLRVKDTVMDTVTTVQEEAADILAAAKDLNEERAAKEEEVKAENQISDETVVEESSDEE